jgi:hypothetical protein
VFEPKARFPAPGELVERPVGRGTKEGFARFGRAFFWVLFLARAKKSTSPAVREPQLLLLSRAQSARTIQDLDSGFRRNDKRERFRGNDKQTE